MADSVATGRRTGFLRAVPLTAALVLVGLVAAAGHSASAPRVVTAGATTTTTPSGVSIRQFPVQGLCWFTDTWGAPRSGGRHHEGVDIIAKAGQNLYAADDGVLTKQYIAAPGTLAGNGWRLTRADGTYFFYAHLSAFAPGLKVGSTVKVGQIIGLVGMTGSAGTPHLHFEVHPHGGAAVNPTAIVRAVDGCKVTSVPPQPGTTPTTTTPTTVPPTTVPPTTVPRTTVPPTTVPRTTVPPTTVPVPTPSTGPADKWEFIAPVRALDTGGAKLAPGAATHIKVNALSGVPAGVSGVMVRLAVRNVTKAGFATVFPCDAPAPLASTISYAPDRLNATMTLVKVVGGEVCLSSSTAVDVRFDVVGIQSANGVGVRPQLSKRAMDTRTGSPIPANGTRSASLSALGVPAGTKAVTLTITLLRPATAGSIGIGACGGTPWIMNFTAAPAQVFSGIVRTTDAGICVSSSVQVHVVLDASGAWTGTQALRPTAPRRLFDSRSAGIVSETGKIVSLAAIAGSSRAQLTVTVIGGSSAAALLAWNCADAKPTASVAYTPSATNNTVTMTLNVTGGALCLASTANLHVVVDVTALG